MMRRICVLSTVLSFVEDSSASLESPSMLILSGKVESLLPTAIILETITVPLRQYTSTRATPVLMLFFFPLSTSAASCSTDNGSNAKNDKICSLSLGDCCSC